MLSAEIFFITGDRETTGGIHMTHHAALWHTISVIANDNNLSRSAMARICGMDATTFNPSKQFSSHGQPRWISTETLSKILRATGTTPIAFAQIFQSFLDQPQNKN